MKRSNIKQVIKEFFFLYPGKRLRVREIERELKIHLPSVIRYTGELVKEGIIKVIKIGNVRFFAADRASKEFLSAKKLFNIESLVSSGLIEHIETEYGNPPIVLFGSYAKGEDVENSDIDLYVEGAGKISNLDKYEKKLHRHIQLFCYENIRRIPNKELANNIINGITLNGFVEVFK